MTDGAPAHEPRRRWVPFVVGAIAGLGSAWWVFVRRPPEDVPVARPLAPAAEAAAWTEEGERRGKPLEAFPDPPGVGEVVSARYWVSLPAYDMEIRRRGGRVTLGIRGTDVQVAGGAWTAFAEGRITGDPRSFRRAVATVVWSCVGLRYRGATDGVARLTFADDGKSLVVAYLQGYEALHAPIADTYVKAHGRLAVGSKPPYGAILGQVPYTSRLRKAAPDAEVVVTGRVLTVEGDAVPDALVQLKGVDRTRTHADGEGRFRLVFRGADAPWTQSVCAGAAGHRNGETVLFTGDPTDDVVVELAALPPGDHAAYAWVHPAPDRDGDDVAACGTCHSWQYTEWLGSRHARMADHGHVLFERDRMRRAAPEAPDDCAACHQPAWAATSGSGVYQPRGVLAGNHCDFCHKVSHVDDLRKPGVFGSLVLARPDPARLDRPGRIHQVFGPAADVSYAYMGASYNPGLSTSHLCAGCHQGGGVPGRPKVDTFEEWRRWAAVREDGRFRSCQDCHMPAGVDDADGKRIDLFAWESMHRAPSSVHSHAFPGATPSLGASALKLDVAKTFDAAAGRWRVVVTVTNAGAGHAVPTGTWTKHVAVGVWARQGARWLAAEGGERADLVAGGADAGPLVAGDWRRPPGRVFGWRRKGGDATPPDFWAPPDAADLEDRRLPPDVPVRLEATFVPVVGGPGAPPEVEVRVVHRRGAIGAGAHETPWDRKPYDPAPEVEWARIVR